MLRSFSLDQARHNTEELIHLAHRTMPSWPDLLSTGSHALTTFINPLSVHTSLIYPDFLPLLRTFDFVFIDGVLLSGLAARLTASPVTRVAFDGNSLAPEIFRLSAKFALRVYLVGGADGVAESAAEVFYAEYGLRPIGTMSGYFFSSGQRQRSLEALASARPDIVVAGMGTYRQERFLIDLVALGWRGFGFTCGAYLEQAAKGTSAYYPQLIDALNLRALYRTIRNPRRLLPRYVLHYAPFYLSALSLRPSGPVVHAAGHSGRTSDTPHARKPGVPATHP